MKIKQKTLTNLSVVEIALLVVVLSFVAFIGYRLIAVQTSDSQYGVSQEVPAGNNSVQSLIPSRVISNIKAALADDFSLTDDRPESRSEVKIKDSKSLPYWRLPGRDFYTRAAKGSAIDVTFYEADSSGNIGFINKKFSDTLKQQFEEAMYEDDGANFIALAKDRKNARYSAFVSNRSVCLVDKPFKGEYAPMRSISCADFKDFEAPSRKAEPFARAYIKASPESKDSLAIGYIETYQSKTKGYELARVGLGQAGSLGGAVGKFYRKGEGSWKFFKGVQMGLPCDAYKSPELRAAFKGETCILPYGGQSKVW